MTVYIGDVWTVTDPCDVERTVVVHHYNFSGHILVCYFLNVFRGDVFFLSRPFTIRYFPESSFCEMADLRRSSYGAMALGTGEAGEICLMYSQHALYAYHRKTYSCLLHIVKGIHHLTIIHMPKSRLTHLFSRLFQLNIYPTP